MPFRIAWIGGGELAPDREAFLVGCQRPRPVARSQPHVANLVEAHAHVALPPGIARIGGGELAPDREAFLGGCQCPRPVARSPPHVANLVEAHAHVALPART